MDRLGRMTVKTLIFCDICNAHCVQQVDRRKKIRDDSTGRRFSDAGAWIEGDLENISEFGWIVTSKNKHICPRCYQHHKDAVFSL